MAKLDEISVNVKAEMINYAEKRNAILESSNRFYRFLTSVLIVLLIGCLIGL